MVIIIGNEIGDPSSNPERSANVLEKGMNHFSLLSCG